MTEEKDLAFNLVQISNLWLEYYRVAWWYS